MFFDLTTEDAENHREFVFIFLFNCKGLFYRFLLLLAPSDFKQRGNFLGGGLMNPGNSGRSRQLFVFRLVFEGIF